MKRPRFTRVWLLAVLSLGFVGDALGVSATATLPDWSGQWGVVGLTQTAIGPPAESREQIRKVFGEPRPTYRPEWRAKIEASNHSRPAQRICAWGFPFLMMEAPQLFEVLVTPKETVLIFSSREIRHVYTDGRSHPPREEIWPTFWGHSIGHWEGQTLVIDTIAAKSPFVPAQTPLIPLFIFGSDQNDLTWSELVAMLSDQAHFVERLRMLENGQLEDQMTIDDPQALAAPWHLSHRYKHESGVTEIIHEDCDGNDRNPIVNGEFTLK
jgi:hypothetical protein